MILSLWSPANTCKLFIIVNPKIIHCSLLTIQYRQHIMNRYAFACFTYHIYIYMYYIYVLYIYICIIYMQILYICISSRISLCFKGEVTSPTVRTIRRGSNQRGCDRLQGSRRKAAKTHVLWAGTLRGKKRCDNRELYGIRIGIFVDHPFEIHVCCSWMIPIRGCNAIAI